MKIDNPNNSDKLDISICNDQPYIILIPLILDKNGINISNPYDPFFTEDVLIMIISFIIYCKLT